MKKKDAAKRVTDVLMTLLLLFVMAYQVTHNMYHEWLGAAMLLLFIVHNILNIKWYGGLFKGKYSAKRILWTIVNFSTLAAILLTGYSGIVMSRHLFKIIGFGAGMATARNIHLCASYWSFVLMSCHLGIHWSMVTAAVGKKAKQSAAVRWTMRVMCFFAAAAALYGAVRFYQQDIYAYMFLKNRFVFLDFQRESALVILDNAAMMTAFAYFMYYLTKSITEFTAKKRKTAVSVRKGLVNLLPAALVILLTFVNVFSVKKDSDFGAQSWSRGNHAESSRSTHIQERTRARAGRRN